MNEAIRATPYCIFQSDTIREWYVSQPTSAVISDVVLPNGYDETVFFPGTSPVTFDKPTALFAGKPGK